MLNTVSEKFIIKSFILKLLGEDYFTIHLCEIGYIYVKAKNYRCTISSILSMKGNFFHIKENGNEYVVPTSLDLMENQTLENFRKWIIYYSDILKEFYRVEEWINDERADYCGNLFEFQKEKELIRGYIS